MVFELQDWLRLGFSHRASKAKISSTNLETFEKFNFENMGKHKHYLYKVVETFSQAGVDFFNQSSLARRKATSLGCTLEKNMPLHFEKNIPFFIQSEFFPGWTTSQPWKEHVNNLLMWSLIRGNCSLIERGSCNSKGLIVPKSKREGRQDRRNPAVPKKNLVHSG
jgi:hypothetical protein